MTHALLGALILLVATAIVLEVARVAGRAMGLTDALDLLVAAPILAATQIILTLLFAGVVLRRLDLVTVLVVNAAVSVAVVAAVRPARGPRPRARALARRLVVSSRAHPPAAVFAALASVSLAWRALLALLVPPYGYDALSYHLPTVVDWLQAGRISTSPLNTCCAYYPQNGELLFTWAALLGGRAEYVDLVQIAAALVGALAVAGIARAAALPSHGAVIAASLFVLTPVVLTQSNTAYVDVIFTSAALAAFYLVLRHLETAGRARWGLLACAGVAAALGVGTKPTGIEFGVVLALPLVARAVSRRRPTWRTGARAEALFALPIAALGISWYVRSWVTTGNPFYPMNVTIPGATIFEGTNRLGGPPPELARHAVILQPLLSWYSDLHFWTRAGYSYAEEVGGLGPVWSYLGAILVVVFAVHALQRQRQVFWFFLFPLALFFVIQPDHWLSRYTLLLAAAGSIAVAWALTGTWQPARLRVALAVVALGLAAGGALITWNEVLPGSLGTGVVLRALAHGRRPAAGSLNPDYVPVLGAWHGSTLIAVDLETVHTTSPLAGMRFQNTLLALPRRGNLQAFVVANGVEYIVTRKGSYYDRSARRDPARFTLRKGCLVLTYRVESPAGRRASPPAAAGNCTGTASMR